MTPANMQTSIDAIAALAKLTPPYRAIYDVFALAPTRDLRAGAQFHVTAGGVWDVLDERPNRPHTAILTAVVANKLNPSRESVALAWSRPAQGKALRDALALNGIIEPGDRPHTSRLAGTRPKPPEPVCFVEQVVTVNIVGIDHPIHLAGSRQSVQALVAYMASAAAHGAPKCTGVVANMSQEPVYTLSSDGHRVPGTGRAPEPITFPIPGAP